MWEKEEEEQREGLTNKEISNIKKDFKIGEKLSVIKNVCTHQFEEGEIVTVIELWDDGIVRTAKNEKGEFWGILDFELEKI